MTDEIAKKGQISLEAFAFQQGVDHFYRFIIKDRTLASALSIIEKIISTNLKTMSNEDRADFDMQIRDEIAMFNIPISRGPKAR